MSSHGRKKDEFRRVLQTLEHLHGAVASSQHRPGDGLDALVEAMLSQNTNWIKATRGYRILRRRFDSWTKVMNAPLDDVQRQIAVCGLARMRARRLQAMLRRIKAERGKLSIDFLADESSETAFEYLMGFHGVGPKTAAFTLLYGLGHPILPVDNGVLRVVRRLRLVRAKARDLEAERVLSPLIDAGRHRAAHALLFRHAGQRCRPRNPKCHECPLLKLCTHGRRVVRHRPPGSDELPPPPPRRRPPLARFASAGIPMHGDHDADRPQR